MGGHSDGPQMVRVRTARGPLVLASDASHHFANMRREIPFPIVFDVGEMAAGWRLAKKLAGGDETLVIPGHDPLLRRMFPAAPRFGGRDPAAARTAGGMAMIRAAPSAAA